MKAKLGCLGTGLSLLFLASSSSSATTFPVIHTADSGAGSLRQAILDANANVGTDTITFNIPGSGVHTITPGVALPAITDPVIIDGYTQPGASPNTLAIGNDAVLKIEISGVNQPNSNVLVLSTGASTIRGLVINRTALGLCIVVDHSFGGGGGNTITGNFLGTDPSGSAFLGGTSTVLRVSGPSNTIGGPTPAARNVIVGGGTTSTGPAVNVEAFGNNVIQGNYIGVNAAGTAALQPSNPTAAFSVDSASINNLIGGSAPGAGNVILGTQRGVWMNGAINNVIQGNFIGTNASGTASLGGGDGIATGNGPSGTIIGGSAPGAGNVISGGRIGILLGDGPTGTIIQGNRIGTDVTGTLPIPNSDRGIWVQVPSVGSAIGGVNPGEGNIIAFNRVTGISVDGGAPVSGWAIRGNSIFSNGGLGIDLDDNGVTFNDDGDGDAGSNGLQNFPIITSVTFAVSSTTIQGVLNSAASTTFDVDFFSTPQCAARTRTLGEGHTFLATRPVTTDGSGNASFSFVLPVALAGVPRISATATDPGGNTSEFSERILLSSTPPSGPASGGTALALSGMLFAAPATVTIQGVPATGVVVNGPGSISAVAPARPPGSVNDIVVTVPGFTGTLPAGYVADFLDVPSGTGINPFVDKLVANLITSGCGGGNFCPGDPVTRAQMAVFLLRGFNGACFVPPPATGTVFADVPSNSFAAAFIEALAAAQVTGGCGGGNYCPGNPVTRDQMAVFLLRTAGGPTYVPPDA